MKKFIIVAICLMMAVGIYLSMGSVEQVVPQASAGKTYSGTIYVAGMGGHFAAADITVDPSDTANPIKVTNLDRVVIGDKDTHPTHDPRIDVKDPGKLFWSTYKPDKKIDGGRTAHVGVSDLKNGNVIKDQPVALDAKAEWIGALYCASGQTKDAFLPVTMTDLPYIDVFAKSDLSHKQRVFLDYKLGESFFFHGTNNDQMDKFVLVVNLKTEGKPNGKIDAYLLDLKALESGNAKILKKNQFSGEPGKTLTFRQDFTPDGKYIVQSGADRMFLLDGKTLDVLDKEMMTDGENHDAVSSPDGKYAILTLRASVGEEKDGQLQLYDINAKKLVGKPTSVCMACHDKIGIHGNATLCGADVTWK